MQAPLAAIGFLLALWSWWSGSGWAWLLGGVLIFAVIPFTLIVIRPTNNLLMSDQIEISSPEAAHLLRRWGRLHAVRSALSLLAFLVFLFALGRGPGSFGTWLNQAINSSLLLLG
jgi:hypothetical protein